MRPEASKFSVEPDRALGAALRAALDRPGDARFAAGVVARARAAGVGSSRAVLARWARVALAAAVVAALGVGILAAGEPAAASFDEVWVAGATGSSAAAELFTAPAAPDASIVLAPVATN